MFCECLVTKLSCKSFQTSLWTRGHYNFGIIIKQTQKIQATVYIFTIPLFSQIFDDFGCKILQISHKEDVVGQRNAQRIFTKQPNAKTSNILAENKLL